ncbi:transmembrane protein [Ceratobasidium sp. AG-Ba]|nr:transmembrane protein [Ceratobasidium sp. AG-Ba]
MKAIFTAASVLGFALAAFGVPSQGHISKNAMRSIYGVRGGGLEMAFAPGQATFAGGDVIRALGLNQFIGNLYLQPVNLAHEIGQGKPGPASLGLKSYAPSFHIKGGALYQLNNETSVLYANVVNVTETLGSHATPKLQLYLENQRRGVGGKWEWHDTTLHFKNGGWTNYGNGSYGIYVDFNVTQEYPDNCIGITLHSFGDEDNHFN